MSESKINFIYVGRLVKEKWFDLLLHALEVLYKDLTVRDRFHIHVFGNGELSQHIPSYECITYHGHQPKERIHEVWKNCHYTLMPSQFLETFGLSALESLSFGIPVIGYPKWGLLQFLTPETSLSFWQKLDSFLREIIQNFDTIQRQELSKKCKNIAFQYNQTQRYEQFTHLLWSSTGTILLVSDFTAPIGGIEVYLHETKRLLESKGHTVILVGSSAPHSSSQRFRGLWTTLANWQRASNIRSLIREYNPDLVRRHSIHRHLWWLPLWLNRNISAKQWIMYHDFGLFHPYPSRVYDEQQLYYPDTWSAFVYAAKKTHTTSLYAFYASIPLVWMKRWLIRLLKTFLVMFDLHLVPSAYMESIVKHHYKNHSISITILSHFQ